eukprot:CAMPEP_0194398812 /NCGR_PEP_ID=MMETSP0174-20130528/126316_1 /TAXON_ID=216777 /ORGANISM="Proboscia alata, Strain PI-D3" /LENGTH=182 /DNA_ID=CAMNT_0039195159 /DNA_START=31 /DNA_END=580 /DNA_ORIENTATION=-
MSPKLEINDALQIEKVDRSRNYDYVRLRQQIARLEHQLESQRVSLDVLTHKYHRSKKANKSMARSNQCWERWYDCHQKENSNKGNKRVFPPPPEGIGAMRAVKQRHGFVRKHPDSIPVHEHSKIDESKMKCMKYDKQIMTEADEQDATNFVPNTSPIIIFLQVRKLVSVLMERKRQKAAKFV